LSDNNPTTHQYVTYMFFCGDCGNSHTRKIGMELRIGNLPAQIKRRVERCAECAAQNFERNYPNRALVIRRACG